MLPALPPALPREPDEVEVIPQWQPKRQRKTYGCQECNYDKKGCGNCRKKNFKPTELEREMLKMRDTKQDVKPALPSSRRASRSRERIKPEPEEDYRKAPYALRQKNAARTRSVSIKRVSVMT